MLFNWLRLKSPELCESVSSGASAMYGITVLTVVAEYSNLVGTNLDTPIKTTLGVKYCQRLLHCGIQVVKLEVKVFSLKRKDASTASKLISDG